eukprot:144231-Amphidinium_carterae.1
MCRSVFQPRHFLWPPQKVGHLTVIKQNVVLRPQDKLGIFMSAVCCTISFARMPFRDLFRVMDVTKTGCASTSIFAEIVQGLQAPNTRPQSTNCTTQPHSHP